MTYLALPAFFLLFSQFSVCWAFSVTNTCARCSRMLSMSWERVGGGDGERAIMRMRTGAAIVKADVVVMDIVVVW